MATDWQMIRETLNATVDACEKLEALEVSDMEKGDHRARMGDYDDGVAVGDFYTRFWKYPEGAQRDIMRICSQLGIGDLKYTSELGRALVNTAKACAEAIGISGEDLSREAEGFAPHCPTAGSSVKSQLAGIGGIYRNWMVPGIAKAVAEYRKVSGDMGGG